MKTLLTAILLYVIFVPPANAQSIMTEIDINVIEPCVINTVLHLEGHSGNNLKEGEFERLNAMVDALKDVVEPEMAAMKAEIYSKVSLVDDRKERLNLYRLYEEACLVMVMGE